MNGYLQRLFDRGAAFAAAPPSAASADVAPAMTPASPAVGFDQRLAEPGLAQAFGVLGVLPDPDAMVEPQPPEDAGAPRVSSQATVASAAPIATPQSQERSTDRMAPGVPPRHSTEDVREIERFVRLATTVSPLPVHSEQVEPHALRPPPDVASVEPPVRPPQPLASVHHARIPAPREQGERAPSAVPATPRHVEPPPPAFADLPQDRRASMTQPETGVGPLASGPTLAPERSPARPPPREVEPLRPAPAPLELPHSTAPDPREVQRIVRDAVRAELARAPAAAQGADRRRGAAPASDRDSANKPAPRPASAREASVIGELESSSSPLTIYGLRRR